LLSLNKLYIILLIGFGYSICNSQNLISNSSFERVDTPVYWNSGEFINSSYFPATRNVTDWDWYNSPDYFSQNAQISGAFRDVPLNDIGVSYAKHGIAYGGIISFVKAGETKEYISQHLTNPLKFDSVYCLSFFTSRADRVTYSIKNLGAYFSVNPPTLFSNFYINTVPQVMTSTYVTDSIGWTEIQGCFIAQGGEEYITIGNFNSNANTDTLFIGSTNPHPGANGYAYYYIDSVTLYQNNFPTAIKEIDKDDRFSVYPNPASSVISIKISESIAGIEACRIKITDVLGREILVSEFKEQLNISQFEKGIYFLSLFKSNELIGTKKIIKE
jgi:hypothetical protein